MTITVITTPGPAPDARIRVGTTGPFVGTGVLSPTRQSVSGSVDPGATHVLEVSVANIGGSAGTFRLSGTAEAGGFRARFLDGDRDVTDPVDAGGFTTPRLEPGGSYLLTVRVTAPSAGPATAGLRILATSTDDPQRVDEVHADLTKSVGDGALARTGDDLGGSLALAVCVVVGGAALVRLGRSRPRRGHAMTHPRLPGVSDPTPPPTCRQGRRGRGG